MIWNMKKGYYRVHQKSLNALLNVMKYPVPKLLTGAGCLKELPDEIKKHKVNNVLVVTDNVLYELGLLDDMFINLKKAGIEYSIYKEVQPNPTIKNVENALKIYNENDCSGVIGFGGGSSMDCAKVVAARVTNHKSVSKMRGNLKLRKKLPPFFLVPTTAGTGSETTAVAVVSDPTIHEKFAIGDLKLIPIVAVLDANLMLGLPKHITSTTGMDALTHAIEAYISQSRTKETDEAAKKCIKIVFNSLEKVYEDGSNIELREEMAMAAFYGGVAFTRAFIGYVHAIAHTLGGLYQIPHGLANAVILPYILDYFDDSIYDRLSDLAIITEIGTKDESDEILAKRFINRIREMNKNMNIPDKFDQIKEEDVVLIAKTALKEANPGYPVPKIMDLDTCITIVRQLME